MYTPINCNLYDQLEAFSVLRTPLKMEIGTESITKTFEECLITNFKTQKEGEFAFVLCNGNEMKIRLDKIVSLNDSKVRDEFGVSCSLPNKK